jgi:tyrosyl-tRNA synthetase
MSIEDLESLEGVSKFNFDMDRLEEEIDIVTFLAETGIFPSKGDARKTIQNGGVSVNRNKVTEIGMKLNKSFLLHEKYLLIQRGKKNYYLIKAE